MGREEGQGGRGKGREIEPEKNECGGNLVQTQCKHVPEKFEEPEEKTCASREPQGCAIFTDKGS